LTDTNKFLNVVSLGAGVQSSALVLMAKHGEITPMPDCAIFADTQAEPKEVYKWLDWLEKQLPFPVHRITKGDIVSESFLVRTNEKTGKKYIAVNAPTYMINKRGDKSMMSRQCTTVYKIYPIVKKIKELAKIKHGEKQVKVIQWMGISYDEAHRMKPSKYHFIENRYPLIEKDFTRGHCLEWMKNNNYPRPPRSACYFCPFKSDAEWHDLKENNPEEFAMVVKYEKDLQKIVEETNFKDPPFLHRSCVPIDEVKFDINNTLDLFGNSCDSGHCGV